MLKPQSLFSLLVEIVVLLLGLLLVQLALTGRFVWGARRPMWLALALVLIALGARTLFRAGRYVSRWLHYVRGVSFVAVGLLMLVVLLAPLQVPVLLAAAGSILAIRGLVCTVLLWRFP